MPVKLPAFPVEAERTDAVRYLRAFDQVSWYQELSACFIFQSLSFIAHGDRPASDAVNRQRDSAPHKRNQQILELWLDAEPGLRPTVVRVEQRLRELALP